MPSRRFRVLVRTPERRAGEHDRHRGGEDPPQVRDPSNPIAEHDSGAREDGLDREELELARLIGQVREARQRLSRLIDTIKADRARWPEREQRWGRLREEVRRFHQNHSTDTKVH